MDSLLFSPFKIKNIEFPNRIVRSATQDFMAEKDGSVSKRNIELYSGLKGIGLIISGFIYVSENGKAMLGQLGLYKDGMTDGYKDLVKAVYDNNVKIFAQQGLFSQY